MLHHLKLVDRLLPRTRQTTVNNRQTTLPCRHARQCRLLILNRLGVRKANVRDETGNDECCSGDTHPDDDHQSLCFVMSSGDRDSLGGTGKVGNNETCWIFVGLSCQGRVGKVFLQLSGNFIGPDTCERKRQLCIYPTCARAETCLLRWPIRYLPQCNKPTANRP